MCSEHHIGEHTSDRGTGRLEWKEVYLKKQRKLWAYNVFLLMTSLPEMETDPKMDEKAGNILPESDSSGM